RQAATIATAAAAMATASHAANATQKNTTDAILNGRQPDSTLIANVAAEYIPSGNTIAHHAPVKRRCRWRTVAYTSGATHSVAATQVTTVAERMTPSSQSCVTIASPARC